VPEECIIDCYGLDVTPTALDFGIVPIGSTHEKTISLVNTGVKPLTITDLYLEPWSDDSLSFLFAWGLPWTLQPNEEIQIDVMFMPEAPVDADPLGQFIVKTLETDPVSVLLTGKAEMVGPMLKVTPEKTVNFGLVSYDAVRTVQLYNAGDEALTLEDVSFTTNTPTQFKMEAVPQTVLEPGDVVDVTLTFTNTTDANGEWEGGLLITSAELPPYDLVLEATTVAPPKCDIQFTPDILNFGITPIGSEKTLSLQLTNTGSADCVYQSGSIYPCDNSFFASLCDWGSSPHFQVVGEPSQTHIQPGETLLIPVRFTPGTGGFELEEFSAVYQFTFINTANGEPLSFPEFEILSESPPPNMTGQSGVMTTLITPEALDFGEMTIGCASSKRGVTLHHVGQSPPFFLQTASLVGCGPEFTLHNLPPIPAEGLEISQQSPFIVEVMYQPQQPESDGCMLLMEPVDPQDPVHVIPLHGQGTFEIEETDVFTQSTSTTDIVFVVGNTDSMVDKQALLAQEISTFLSAAFTWQSDVQIGVITPDVATTGGQLQGMPSILKIPGTSVEQVSNQLQVGGEGAAVNQSGLEAVFQALHPVAIQQSTTPCTQDADCGFPFVCNAGICGGSNGGLLREEATLHVIFVTDQDDTSSGMLGFYRDFLQSRKGPGQTHRVQAHALLGENGVCGTSGNRYMELVEETGGHLGSICESSVEAFLGSVGQTVFNLQTHFPLTRQAEPNTLEVSVSGFSCASNNGWSYDQSSNVVIFDPLGSCMPQLGDTLSIEYKTLCELP